MPTHAVDGLIDGLRRGDDRAAGRIRSLVRSSLARLDTHGLGDSWEDLCQEVFLTLLSRRPDRIDPGSVTSYIRRVTHNAYVDLLRREFGRRARRPAGGDAAERVGWRTFVPVERCPDLPAPLGHGDPGLCADVGRALEALPAREQAAVACKYLLELADAEAAALTGRTVSAHRRLSAAALSRMRRRLAPLCVRRPGDRVAARDAAGCPPETRRCAREAAPLDPRSILRVSGRFRAQFPGADPSSQRNRNPLREGGGHEEHARRDRRPGGDAPAVGRLRL